MAEPRAVVDVVGAETGAHQFLEKVSLLVRTFGRAKAGQRIGAVAVANLDEAGSSTIERLLPGRLAKVRPRVRRVDELVWHLGHAVLADHRLQQALRIGDIVEAEAALDAEPVLVGRAVPAFDRDDLVVLDLVSELAADAAIRANAVDGAVRLAFVDIVVVNHRRRHQRAGRTGLHALAAGNAGRRTHRIVEIEHDLFEMAAAGHADHVVDLNFAAGADAEIALDAGVEIDRHGDVAAVGLRHFGRLALGKAAGHGLEPPHGLPKLGIRIVRDFDRRLIGKQKLGDHLARGLGAVGLRLHFHARRRRAQAACRKHALALDLDHADAAIAVSPVAGLRRKAQMRQLDVEPARGAKDRLAGANVDLAFVDGERIRALVRLGIAHEWIARLDRPIVTWLSLPCFGYQCRSGVFSSSGKYFSTQTSGLGAACPRPQIEASRIKADNSSSSAGSHGPCAISSAAFSVPTRHGVHWPQLSSSKNFIRLRATAFTSSLSDRMTTAWEPTKQPYFSSVPKSSGRSAMDSGKMPPEAPPGR